MFLNKHFQIKSKIQELRKSPAWRQAMRFSQSIAAIVLASICILGITDVARTNRPTTLKVHAENHSASLFVAVAAQPSSPSRLAARMPDSFDQHVARVV